MLEQLHAAAAPSRRRSWTTCCAPGLDVWVYRGADWFIRDRDAPHVAHEQATVQFAPTVIGDLRGVLDGAVKIVGVSDDHALVARCEAELRAARRARTRRRRARSSYYLDVTHPDANKGMVVRVDRRACSAFRSSRSRPSATCPTTC